MQDAFSAQPVAGVAVDFSSEIAAAIPSIFGIGELVGLVIAGIVLVIMLGTLIGAGLPILSALVGVGIGVMGTLSLSGIVDMVSVTPVLGVMLGLAVGIDYALFIVNRHRRQLKDGYELRESISLATGTSGNAVVFAGMTVFIALLALNVTGIPFLGVMGSVGAACVAIAVLIALTFTPALLSLIGERVLSGRERAALASHAAPAAVPPVRPMSNRRAIGSVLLGVAVLGLLAVPAFSMRLGLPDGSSEAAGFDPVPGLHHRRREVRGGRERPAPRRRRPAGVPDEDEVLAEQVNIGQKLSAFDGVVAVAPIGTSKDRTTIAFQVVPVDGPTSVSTEQLVKELRAASPLEGGTQIAVAGLASGNIDISQKLADALPIYLGARRRSLAAHHGHRLPVAVRPAHRDRRVHAVAVRRLRRLWWRSTSGACSAGSSGSTTGPILNFLPTMLVGILFGLAMDYMLFLTSGMREAYVHGAPARTAVVLGVRAGRSVVTAAAIIMVAVFGGFIFSDSAMIQPIGFALAFGVLLDAFVVRMFIVPALMHIAGDWAWWLPKWLDRLIPNVDVEGASLERRNPHVASEHKASDGGRSSRRARGDRRRRLRTEESTGARRKDGRPFFHWRTMNGGSRIAGPGEHIRALGRVRGEPRGRLGADSLPPNSLRCSLRPPSHRPPWRTPDPMRSDRNSTASKGASQRFRRPSGRQAPDVSTAPRRSLHRRCNAGVAHALSVTTRSCGRDVHEGLPMRSLVAISLAVTLVLAGAAPVLAARPEVEVVSVVTTCDVSWDERFQLGDVTDSACLITTIRTPGGFIQVLHGRIPADRMAEFRADGSPTRWALNCLTNYGFLVKHHPGEDWTGLMVFGPSVRHFSRAGHMVEICELAA